MTAAPWNVLVVDDEEDVHNVTRLALKRKTWRGRPIALTSARSASEAREILTVEGAAPPHCAIIDVVMETDDAGLKLCDFVRSRLPRTTRIILRTGQPGAAPQEKVLNDYDIDYYLAKTDVTEARLFLTLRACFRSSLDVATILEVGRQLRAFTSALQEVTTTRDRLVAIMGESVRFLEDKYAAKIAFVHDAASATLGRTAESESAAAAVSRAHKEGLAPMQLHAGGPLGLSAPNAFVVTTTRITPAIPAEKSVGDKLKRWVQKLMKEDEMERDVGLVITFERDAPREREELTQDLELFLANWRVAESWQRMQDGLLRDRMDAAKSYGQT